MVDLRSSQAGFDDGVPDEAVLVLVGSSRRGEMNHPASYLIEHTRRAFATVDVVDYVGFYEGPPARALQKLVQGARALVRAPVTIVKGPGGNDITVRNLGLPRCLKTLVSDLWFFVCSRRSLRKNYALCLYGDPQNALLVRILKRMGIIQTVVYEDWDYYPAVPYFTANACVRRITAWREHVAIRDADMVISVSETLADLRREQGAHSVRAIPNGIDYERFSQAQVKRPHLPTMIFTGTVSEEWGTDLPIKALPRLLESIPDLQYVMVGPVAEDCGLKTLVGDLGLERHVHFTGLIPYEDLPGYLAAADIGIATSRENLFRRYCFPMKLMEYMAAGLPVVCTNIGDAPRIVLDANAGAVVDFTVDSFVAGVLSLLQDREKYQGYSQNAAQCAKSYEWNTLYQHRFKEIAELHQPGSAGVAPSGE